MSEKISAYVPLKSIDLNVLVTLLKKLCSLPPWVNHGGNPLSDNIE